MLPRAQINVTPMIDVHARAADHLHDRHTNNRVPGRAARSDHADARPEEPDEVVLGIDRKRDLFPFYHWGPSAARECATCDWCGCLAWIDSERSTRTARRIGLLYLKADSELPFRVLSEAIEIARTSGAGVAA